ncbi:MAG: ROK family protein [Oscillospiraceae bacterium]
MKQVANHDTMRSTNLLTVFHCIGRYGPITKREIQAITGLSWGSVSNLTTTLIQKGILVEKDKFPSSTGRSSQSIEIDSDHNLIIGVDVNLQGITGVVIDLKGTVKQVIKEPIKGVGRTVLMQQTKSVIRRLMALLPDKGEVKGLGISFPGHVDQRRGISIKIHHFDGFENYPVSDDIKNEFRLDVMLEHDPNCIAIAAHALGVAQDVDDFVLIRMCRGIGMGIYNKGIFRGYSGASGEIGHMIMNPDGPRCMCGHQGCLETYTSVNKLLEHSLEYVKKEKTSVFAEIFKQDGGMALQTLRRAAEEKDEFALSLLSRAAQYAGIAVSNVVNILDPSAVILSGEILGLGDTFIPKMFETAQTEVWRDSKIDFRLLYDHCEMAAVGAASLFIDKIFLDTIL